MLNILLYLAMLPILPAQEEDLKMAAAMYQAMGHPAVSYVASDTGADRKKEYIGYVLFWHGDNGGMVSGDVISKSGLRIRFISVPSEVPVPKRLPAPKQIRTK